MDRGKFWGTLMVALDREKCDPETIGKIITRVMTALDYAEEENLISLKRY